MGRLCYYIPFLTDSLLKSCFLISSVSVEGGKRFLPCRIALVAMVCQKPAGDRIWAYILCGKGYDHYAWGGVDGRQQKQKLKGIWDGKNPFFLQPIIGVPLKNANDDEDDGEDDEQSHCFGWNLPRDEFYFCTLSCECQKRTHLFAVEKYDWVMFNNTVRERNSLRCEVLEQTVYWLCLRCWLGL